MHIEKAHALWKKFLTGDETAIDATCGNGKDTAALAKLLPKGHVHSLDIQEIALERAKKNLKQENLLERVTLHLMSHTAFPPLSPSLIVYNLGYLPGSDKKITTLTENSLMSIKEALKILKPHGALSITCYPGHSEGKRETEAILQFCLDTKLSHTLFEGEKAFSPLLIWVEKDCDISLNNKQ